MLTPEQLDDAGESVAEVYRQIEAELLDYLTQAIIDSDLSPQRAKTALNLLSQSMPQKVKAIIDDHADEIDQAVKDEVEDLLAKSDRFDLARIAQDALGATASTAALTAQTLAVTTSIKDLLARDNLALSEAARSKYLQWTTWATTQVATGNMTADKAMKKAVRELARGGLSIPFVTYKDEETGDTTVTNHVDVAIQRHLRSLIAQGSANLTMQRIDELGCEFVEVSSHIGSRPSHAEWHGRCYHVGGPKTVDGVTYEDFYEGTGYKGIAGPYVALGDQLLGVNCRHSFAPWVPGCPRAYSPDPKHPSGLSNDEIYKLTQKQRMRERAIRQTKRELAAAQRVYDAEPTPENRDELTKVKLRLRSQQERMRGFIKKSNAKGDPEHPVLTRQPRREWAGDMPKRDMMAHMRHDEPLVKISKGEHNALAVSSVVNKREYHRAFERLPLPKPVAESAYRESGRILEATNGTELEHLVAIDSRTGELVTDNLDIAPVKPRTTGFREADIVKIKACENRVVTIHNHPSGKQPSFRDVMTLAENDEIAASIVVGHDGSVWYVATSDSSIAEKLKAGYNSLKDSYGERAEYYALKNLLYKEAGKSIDWRRLR